MINLLPSNTKQQLRAARTNVILINYLIIMGFAVAFLVVACSVSFLYLSDRKATAEKIIATNQTKKITDSSTQTSLASINSTFLTAQNILNRQTSYSDIIMSLGAILPSGIVIDSISLNSNSFGTPITVKAHARTSDDITSLKTNLQGSTQFSNSSIQSQVTNPSGMIGYPIEFSISITINRGIIR